MQKYICTITPNPALDLGGTVDRIRPNEKTYIQHETRFPGGNGVNVARILSRLRVPVLATGFLGGAVGKEIENLLGDDHVRNKFIIIKGNSRISITVSNEVDHRQTRLSFRGPFIEKNEIIDLLNYLNNAKEISLVVIGGSMPPGFLAGDLRKIIELAHKKKIETIVDCPGSILKKIINSKPLLIKPNLAEFQELSGTNVRSISGVNREARKFLTEVPFVCVSSVEEGALLVTRSGSFFGETPKITVNSTVGAGDSMVAAMAAQFHKNNVEATDILRWGLAAAGATLLRRGTALGERPDILSLYGRIKVKQLGYK